MISQDDIRALMKFCVLEDEVVRKILDKREPLETDAEAEVAVREAFRAGFGAAADWDTGPEEEC